MVREVIALGRFWNFIDGESWGFGGGVYNETMDCKWICMRSVFGYGFVAMSSVFGLAMGERKTQHRERQVVLEGERGLR